MLKHFTLRPVFFVTRLVAKTDLHWFCGKIYHLDFQLCFFGDVERRLDLDGDELLLTRFEFCISRRSHRPDRRDEGLAEEERTAK